MSQQSGTAAAVGEIARLLQSGSVRAASTRARKLVAAHPADEALMAAAFTAHMRAGDKKAALSTAARAKKALGGTAAAALHTPMLHLVAGRLDQARAACSEALAAFPDDLALSVMKADLCSRSGLLDEMVATLTPVLRDHPSEPIVHHLLAQAFHRRNEPEKALEHARLALQLGIRSLINLCIIGRGSLATGQPDEAEAALRTALRVRPDDFQALALMSAVQARKGEVAASNETARKAIAVRPFLCRGPTDAARLCVVPEMFRAGFFLWRHSVYAYNNANLSSFLAAPDFAFVHAPMTAETGARLGEAGLVPHVVLNNMVVGEAVNEAAMRAYSAYAAPLRARGVPVVNDLKGALATTRDANSRRFGDEPGFIFPLTRRIDVAGRAEDDWIA